MYASTNCLAGRPKARRAADSLSEGYFFKIPSTRTRFSVPESASQLPSISISPSCLTRGTVLCFTHQKLHTYDLTVRHCIRILFCTDAGFASCLVLVLLFLLGSLASSLTMESTGFDFTELYNDCLVSSAQKTDIRDSSPCFKSTQKNFSQALVCQ